MPISITWTYDTRTTNRPGDFGPGWHVGLRSVTLTKSASFARWLAPTHRPHPERRLHAAAYFLLVAHGSVRALVDDSGNAVASMYYDARDVLLSGQEPGASITALGHNGEHYDADLGLIYLRARWYNPCTGRFHTRDSYQDICEDLMSL